MDSSPSLKLVIIWVPSQYGLLVDLPQRQSVTQLRTSYMSPSDDTILIPPRTHNGPLTAFPGSSVTAMERKSRKKDNVHG